MNWQIITPWREMLDAEDPDTALLLTVHSHFKIGHGYRFEGGPGNYVVTCSCHSDPIGWSGMTRVILAPAVN